MNMHTDFRSQIASAETAGDVHGLAALCRQLLAERAGLESKPKPRPAPRARAKGGELEQYLTNTERLARGLPWLKDGKIGGGCYRYVLVSFANGLRILNGCYPRAKNPDDLSPAVVGARARYLLAIGGKPQIDARDAKRVPRVTSARVISDPLEIERERAACIAMRLPLEARQNAEHRLRLAWTHRHAPGVDHARMRECVGHWVKSVRDAKLRLAAAGVAVS